MNKTKIFIASLLLTASVFAVTGCGKASDSKGTAQESKITNPMDQDKIDELNKSAADAGDLLTGELENKTIKWLSDWDINPDGTGKKTPADLQLFQDVYGGKVEYIQCTYAERYDKLAQSVSSGEGIDFFYAGNLDAFPKGVIRGMFAPIDDYIDFDSPLWEDVQEVNDQFMWDGKHYVAAAQTTGDNVAVVYNRKTVQEAGLDDPADLYANGDWTWDTFEGMLESFCDPDNQRYGIDGWWFEFGLMNTIGVPPVGMQDGKLVSNIGDPAMERVQNWMYDLYQNGCIAIGVGDYGWEAKPNYIGEGKLLFYPVGLYEFYTTPDQWKGKFGDDAFFVPMPKDPEADEYYIPSGVEAYAFVKGGQNPEGVAKYLDCKRFTYTNEEAKAVADSIYVDDYGWTQEMVDMRNEMNDLSTENPVIDLSKGVSADCGDLLDSSLRLTTRGTPWNETYDSIAATVETYINEVNNNTVSD